jgi:hypothetical protein
MHIQGVKQSVMHLPKADVGVRDVSLTVFTVWAKTPHFVISFEQALGQTGENLADAVAATCERDYNSLSSWFNGITPANLPFTVRIQTGSMGASHADCLATELFCDDFGGTNDDLVRMLVVAEADEVFMAAQKAGWDCGASNGEALSRVLAAEIYPAQLGGFASASSWLASVREDFISKTDPTDRNFISIGCGTIFINYLRFQRGIGLWATVTAAGATFDDGYAKLTGAKGAFGPFSNLLARFFPGNASNVANDNPFPLLFGDHFYTIDNNEHAGAIHPLAVELFRMFNPTDGDHFYTTSANERDAAFVVDGYRFEGTAFYILSEQAPNSTSLFRLFNQNNGDHFYTTSEAERVTAIEQDGYVSEGVAGFVFENQVPGTSPVFRLFNPTNGDHFYTTSAAERDSAVANSGYRNEGTACFTYTFASYADEGVACQVFSTQVANTQPLFRLRSTATIDHFYTMSAAERDTAIQKDGYVDEGVACYAYSAAQAGSVPLYRAYNPKSGDHFYTTALAEKNNAVAALGYQDEGVASHVLAKAAAGSTPLLRMVTTTRAWA